jgi:hypothetical protein
MRFTKEQFFKFAIGRNEVGESALSAIRGSATGALADHNKQPCQLDVELMQ